MSIYIAIVDGSSTRTLRDQLLGWFDPEDETPKKLVIEDDDGNNDRFVYAICERLIPIEDSGVGVDRLFLAVLVVDGDVRWRETSISSDSWPITASGQVTNITNNGTEKMFPIFKIEPTGAKTGGYAYKVFVPIRWNVDIGYIGYPLDIVNNGFDTAALTTAKMQADGDDLRVWNGGIEIDRWLQDMDTSTTQVWCNLDFAVKGETLLATAIASSGTIETIDLTDSSDFPSSGIVIIDSEAFTYTSKNDSLNRLLGVTRAEKGTSMAAHTTSDMVWWCQHDLWILYGNSSATAPVVDDDYKPIFQLSSTNGSWVYQEFGSDDGLRTGAWVFSSNEGIEPYTGNQGGDADPWVEIGLGGRDSNPQDGDGRFYLYNPCEITNTNFTNGEKQKETGGTYQAAIESSANGSTWTQEDIISTPTPTAWTAWSDNEAITSGAIYVGLRLELDGVDGHLEAADCTITIGSEPTITIGSEQGNYLLSCTITNNDSNNLDAISIEYAMSLNEELEVDTDAKTCTDLENNSSQFQALDLSAAGLRDWLPLDPGGASEIEFVDVGTTGVTITITWWERYY